MMDWYFWNRKFSLLQQVRHRRFSCAKLCSGVSVIPPEAPCFGPTHSHIPSGKWKQLGAASCSTAEHLHDLTGTAKCYHKAISRALYSPFPAKKQEVKLNPCQAKLHVYPLFQSNQNDKKLATCYLSNAKNTSCWTRIAAFWMVFCSCQKTS